MCLVLKLLVLPYVVKIYSTLGFVLQGKCHVILKSDHWKVEVDIQGLEWANLWVPGANHFSSMLFSITGLPACVLLYV